MPSSKTNSAIAAKQKGLAPLNHTHPYAPGSVPASALAPHTHTTAQIVSGTFADARIAESNVTQHEAALTLTESQISDFGNYQLILAEGAFIDGDKIKLDSIETFADVTDADNVSAALEAASLALIDPPAEDDQFLVRDASVSNDLVALTFARLAAAVLSRKQVTKAKSQVDRPFTMTISDTSGNTSTTTSAGRFMRIGRHFSGGSGALVNIDTSGLTGTDHVQLSAPKSIGLYATGELIAGSLDHPTGGLQFYLVASDADSTKFKIASVGDDNTRQYLTVADVAGGTIHSLTFRFYLATRFDDDNFDDAGITFDSDLLTWDNV